MQKRPIILRSLPIVATPCQYRVAKIHTIFFSSLSAAESIIIRLFCKKITYIDKVSYAFLPSCTARTYACVGTLQHTATHTATHCNTLQHTATHCNTLVPRTYVCVHAHTHSKRKCTAKKLNLTYANSSKISYIYK